ncbi:Phosphate regulon transcriptional regulatory protein PhoB [Rosistilla ulvae]|uniref:Phosphate regulon transcriptional regulatory protein PhoB n=1 Tax=Rosistilla ulvae TaxID=1930277 RepID=A0A517M3G2_9BACT|nr:response regulator [Rosistilla ulvae]QDS89405.1 Phosphate regulon transcriptional regulatory protein PhoB [Rosistilla ulvae]
MPNIKVLVVEDDLSVAEVLVYNLKKEGFEVSRALDGRDALNQARLKLPDLVILDVMLPSLNGLEVCRTLRAGEDTKNISILMLTAKSEDSDQIAGFSIGADDYVCKPFSVAVLLQRVKALLRRREQAAVVKNQDVVTYKSVSVDRRRYKATVGEEPLDLTRSEFRLLDTLIRQPGRVFDRAELIDAALGEDTMVLERTIDVHIRALRKKLGPYADVIETVRGVGYRFSEAMHEEV